MIIFHLQQNSRTVLLIGCWLKIRMTSAQIVSHCDWNTTYWWNFAELQDAGLSLWFSVEQGTLRILRFMSSNQNNAETTYKKRVWQMKNRLVKECSEKKTALQKIVENSQWKTSCWWKDGNECHLCMTWKKKSSWQMSSFCHVRCLMVPLVLSFHQTLLKSALKTTPVIFYYISHNSTC